ncbi:MAG TPA: hypothetical protein VLC10_03260, partial [Patescibacteria group bacterium]|nr:hypothetical protein [Patescibacteria group bacterium]
MKKRNMILIGVAVAFALGAAGFYLFGGYCSLFSYKVSWAWSGIGETEKKQQRCEQAGCKAVRGSSFDDPNSIDEEYTNYRCVPA